MTHEQAQQRRRRVGEFLPGAPCADPSLPAPLAQKRNPAGGTEPGHAVLSQLRPRPELGSARGRPTYLRVPTARPRVAAAVAAAAAGPGDRAPRPCWPLPSLGLGGPAWVAGPGHISEGGLQLPTTPSGRGRRRRGLPTARWAVNTCCARGCWGPGAQGGGARSAPHPRPAELELDARARGGSRRSLVFSHSSF